MEYENKFVGLSSVTSNDLKLLRYELEYGDYIQYQLNRKYYITEEDMQKLSGIYNRDFYK